MKQTIGQVTYTLGSRGLTTVAVALFAYCLVVTESVMAAEAVKKVDKPAVKKPATSRKELKSKATQLAAGVAAAEQALTPDELVIAKKVEIGEFACELGVKVSIKADLRLPGYFDLEEKKLKFRMSPVVTSTGAIRLQDERAGAVWIQLANKSMLMSQKQGSRLADNCMSPAQMAVAQAMENNPPASLLEPLPVANKVVATMPAPTGSAAASPAQ
ncbi:MAG: hypothetical protein IPN53_02350 [Comamonadaceae bacterium]|nr:hypothetical protein [Comamonadaceae bacterium]